MKICGTPAQQTGLALVISLIFLVLVTLIAVTAVNFSSVGVMASTNEEMRLEAYQQAQSVADAIISNPDSTPVIGVAGNTFCTTGVPNCTSNTLTLPGNAYATEISNGTVEAQVERLAPTFGAAPLGYSLRCFRSARFSVEGQYDATTQQQSRSTVRQGLVLPVQAGQC